jgi:putative ABC transport system permease protein
VIILGYEYWQRRPSNDPAIVGKTVPGRRDTPPTIIGVMPPGVRFLPSPGHRRAELRRRCDGRFPEPVADPWRQVSMWDVVGRLKPGVTPRRRR